MTENGGWWPTDLVLVLLATVVSGAGIHAGLGGYPRVLLALPLVLLLPGYALTAVLFPENDRGAVDFGGEDGLRAPRRDGRGIDWVERLVLSVTLSLVAVPATGYALDHLGPRIDAQVTLVGVVGVTAGLLLVAFVRRLRLPPERRYRATLPAGLWRLRADPARQRPLDRIRRPTWFAPALLASLLLLGASVAYAGVSPPGNDGFTEFYVETGDVTGDTTSMYPSELRRGEPATVAVGVGNRERRDVEYTVVVLQQEVDRDGDGEATVRREDELARERVAVDAGETRNATVSFAPTFGGDDVRLLLLLYEGEPPADPGVDSAYRALDLDVTVSGGGQAAPSDGGAEDPTAGGERPTDGGDDDGSSSGVFASDRTTPAGGSAG